MATNKIGENPYVGERVALLTQHGKEQVIAPVLAGAIGCKVERVAGYDTDLLGTFTRDIPRAGIQIEAARKKARIGMQISEATLGLASEGSFGTDPFAGILPWNVEFLIFIDALREIEVVGVAEGQANSAHCMAEDWDAVVSFARKTRFPEHHLVLRPESENDPRISKGIASWPDLEAAFTYALRQSINSRVFLEVDLRASANPTRMGNIRLAAENLVQKLRSQCPVCGTPGFWIVERIGGLPCSDCGAPTREIRAEIHGCPKCEHRVMRERPLSQYADPGRCDYCNP
ncbi:hypothetical protein BJI67_08050 [Acidihalobacter aeolianus]|uniref:DUF6671 domain-containing protein n=1 Tax=Acidihalobacter aeolianus TaxID=2792603 RepID=A0A1D8K7U8_9GAMM|nr:DUF6671 family protein [Acidihalobacter aeolianus]AOV17016.1 hypothetical protein BJI67_08050 [Acidihalobacter aeolianus]